MLLRQPFCYDSSTQPLPVFLFFLTQGNACLRRTIHTFFPDKVCSKMLLSLESPPIEDLPEKCCSPRNHRLFCAVHLHFPLLPVLVRYSLRRMLRQRATGDQQNDRPDNLYLIPVFC